jgi:hypothetical protein
MRLVSIASPFSIGSIDAEGIIVTNSYATPAYDLSIQLILRASNRVIVGLPLCRDDDYLSTVEAFSRLAAIRGPLLGAFPQFLKPYEF